jgi:2,4-dienoyl-CoA reductase (NADPH2)
MMKQHSVATPYPVGDVHFYSTQIEGELVLFDTGPPTEQCWQQLNSELDLSRLRHVFMTHCHIDHWGQAARLARETGATIYLPQRDADKIVHHERRIQGMMDVMQSYGFTQPYLDQLRAEIDNDDVFPPIPASYEIVENSRLESRFGLKVLACPGHSQSDLVYRLGNQAVSGDVLLRGIFQSPLLDIDLQTFRGRFHNYRAYCTSLGNLVTLRDCRILPGHRQWIDSVDDTILFYLRKLLDRTLKLKPFGKERNIATLIQRLFLGRELSHFQTYLKASEIIFMQDLLTEPQLLQTALEKAGLFDILADDFMRLDPRGAP